MERIWKMANHLAQMVFQVNFTKFSGMISIYNVDVVASINYSFEKRQLSICQKRGIITLVPKNRLIFSEI